MGKRQLMHTNIQCYCLGIIEVKRGLSMADLEAKPKTKQRLIESFPCTVASALHIPSRRDHVKPDDGPEAQRNLLEDRADALMRDELATTALTDKDSSTFYVSQTRGFHGEGAPAFRRRGRQLPMI